MSTGLQLPRDFDALRSQVSAVLQACAGRPAVILIAGGTSTGKTTLLAEPLAAALGERAWHLSQDMQQCCSPDQLDPRYARDDPAHYGIAACLAALQAHVQSRAIEWPRYDFARGTHGPAQHLAPRPVLIVEGLYALHPSLCAHADLRLYVEAPAAVRLVRRLFRSRYERYPDRPLQSGAVLRFATTVQAAHRDHVRPQRERADQCLTTALAFDDTRARFDLAALAVTRGSVHWQAAFDAHTSARLVRLEDHRWRLRVEQDDRCYLDLPLDQAAADALRALDPDAG